MLNKKRIKVCVWAHRTGSALLASQEENSPIESWSISVYINYSSEAFQIYGNDFLMNHTDRR